MTKKHVLIYFALSVLVISFLYVQQSKNKLDPRIEQILSVRDIYNNPAPQLKTNFIIINFWASWCPPCIEETPSLVRFTEKHAQHFTLLALSQDSTKKDIEDFIRTFPALKSNFVTIIHDDTQRLGRSYKVEKLPETFIYSVKQNKYFQVSGSTNWDDPLVLQAIEKNFNARF